MLKFKLKGKLLTAFMCLGIIPLIVLGVISYQIAKTALEKQSFGLLEAQRNIKAKQIQGFFGERRGDASVLSNNPFTAQAVKDLQAALNDAGGVRSGNFRGNTNERYDAPSSYKDVHDKYHGVFKDYMSQYGYYDLFLMDADKGDVSYTVTKEADFGVRTDEIDSSLRDVWRIAAKEGKVALSDTKPYAPSNGAPAQFVAAPIRENGEIIGVLALQISIDSINNIMSERSGMGDSGETYLVGEDKLMRSDSFLDKTGDHSVAGSFKNPNKGSVTSDAVVDAKKGNEGNEIVIDYNGNPVLSSYKPIDIGGVTWLILAEIDESEAFEPVYDLMSWIFGVLAVAAATIVIVALLITSGITRPISALVAVMQDIQNNSDFSKRVNSTSKDEVGDAANAFDGLLHSLEVAFGEVINVVKSVASGEFSTRVEADVSGSLDDLKQGVNGTAESISETFSTLNNVMDALSDADYTRNIDISDLEGEYKTTVQTGLASMKSSGTAIDAINDVMKTVANGEFDKRIEIKLPGDLGILKDSINQSLQVVENGIEDTSRITVALSKGDLKPRVEANHPGQFGILKTALNDTMNNIGDVVSNIAQAADVVASASNEIADGNADMSKRTEEQASSLEETASSMEELTSTVKQNADNAEQANQLAVGARETANQGGQIVKEAVTAMAEINSSSNKIADIIGVIDEIAFQTNLLALNASVEAARAGEQGRGFAVVATEVRNLAQRSATAAKEIKELIQDSVGKVKVGSELVEKSGSTLDEIVSGVQKVGDMIAEIASASLQQTTGIGQVNQALANMDDITQRNAALAEEASANSENLSSQAQTMNQQVGFFDLGNKTSSGGRGATVVSSTASVKAKKAKVAKPATANKAINVEQPATLSNNDEWEEF